MPPLRAPDPTRHVIAAIRDARFADGLRCPHCNEARIAKWGRFSGRQRYRCSACRRTFSDLTGTPAAYLKKLRHLERYADCFARGLSIRAAALRCRIHPCTSFRWRHRLCGGLSRQTPENLARWVEIGVLRTARSLKGQRRLPRPPRTRGARPEVLMMDRSQVHVLVACDRRGGAETAVVDGVSVFHLNIPSAVAARTIDGRRLCVAQGASGPFLPGSLKARGDRPPADVCGGGLRLLAGRLAAGRGAAPEPPRSLAHVDTMLDYLARLLRWMDRFRGVATKYLPNYLLWHIKLDEAEHRLALARRCLVWSRAP